MANARPGITLFCPDDHAVQHGETDRLKALHPIRRIATLEEVSAMVCHLAGPNGGYITGGVIDIAGGLGI